MDSRNKTLLVLFYMLLKSGGMVLAQNSPIDFETGGYGATWTWTVFENGGNPSLEIVTNPNTGGKWTYWSSDSKESSELIYKDGQAWDGKSTHWNEIGQKWYERTYKDGKKDGKWTWFINGQKKSETYKDGELIESKEWEKD